MDDVLCGFAFVRRWTQINADEKASSLVLLASYLRTSASICGQKLVNT
jgi:hypothetical protein